MKRIVVSEINKSYVGEWQVTDKIYIINDVEKFKLQIKKRFELNGRDYTIREVDMPKLLFSKKE